MNGLYLLWNKSDSIYLVIVNLIKRIHRSSKPHSKGPVNPIICHCVLWFTFKDIKLPEDSRPTCLRGLWAFTIFVIDWLNQSYVLSEGLIFAYQQVSSKYIKKVDCIIILQQLMCYTLIANWSMISVLLLFSFTLSFPEKEERQILKEKGMKIHYLANITTP